PRPLAMHLSAQRPVRMPAAPAPGARPSTLASSPRPSHAAAPARPADSGNDAALRAIAVLADQGRVQEAMAQCRIHLAEHG
ncbi:hypothetical protein NSQ98_25600, partial [Salmonella enterica]|nr:hypothetical protein [Salmonella enterica]